MYEYLKNEMAFDDIFSACGIHPVTEYDDQFHIITCRMCYSNYKLVHADINHMLATLKCVHKSVTSHIVVYNTVLPSGDTLKNKVESKFKVMITGGVNIL